MFFAWHFDEKNEPVTSNEAGQNTKRYHYPETTSLRKNTRKKKQMQTTSYCRKSIRKTSNTYSGNHAEFPIIDKPIRRSNGAGFFGETMMWNNDDSLNKLPPNTSEIIDEIQEYFTKLAANKSFMCLLSPSDQQCMHKVWKYKLEKELNLLILQNQMSYYAYSSLLDIFYGLKTRQFEMATKKISFMIKNRNEFKINKKMVDGIQICH
eukprot:UN07229